MKIKDENLFGYRYLDQLKNLRNLNVHFRRAKTTVYIYIFEVYTKFLTF